MRKLKTQSGRSPNSWLLCLLSMLLLNGCAEPEGERPIEGLPLPEGIPEASIAILPFHDRSQDAEYSFYATGVQEDILNLLSNSPDLLVIARNSAQRYAEESDIDTVAASLGVSHVLQGSLERTEEAVAIDLALFRFGTPESVWNSQYEFSWSDLFELRRAIATDVAAALQRSMGAQIDLALTTDQVDPQAYDWFLEARELIRMPDVASARRGLFLFRSAVERAPEFANAHAGIALAQRALSEFNVAWEDVKDSAIASARRATELDPESAYAAYAMGVVLMGLDGDNAAAEDYFVKAIDIDPNYSDAYISYSELLYLLSRYEESYAQIEAAYQRDPYSPTVRLYQGILLMLGGQYQAALRSVQAAIDIDPDNVFAHVTAGQAYDVANDLLMALAHYGYARALDSQGVEIVVHIAAALTRLGLTTAAEQWLEEARSLSVSESWFRTQGQMLTARGDYEELPAVAAAWADYNPEAPGLLQAQASALSLLADRARRNGEQLEAQRLSGEAIALLREYTAPLRTENGYNARFDYNWSLLSLGVEAARIGESLESTAALQSVVDLYESQPAGMQLPNQRTHLTIAYGALGDRQKALENAELSMQTHDFTYWVFAVYGLEDDPFGVYHGIAEDPAFQDILARMRSDRDQRQQQLRTLMPALMSPEHEDWNDTSRLLRRADNMMADLTIGG